MLLSDGIDVADDGLNSKYLKVSSSMCSLRPDAAHVFEQYVTPYVRRHRYILLFSRPHDEHLQGWFKLLTTPSESSDCDDDNFILVHIVRL